MSQTRREFLLATVFFGVLALVFTWPLLLHPASLVADPADGTSARVGLYVLTWGIHSLASNPLGYFDANIYYPHAQALAFGDHLFGPALLMAPLQWTLASPTLTWNVAVFLSFLLAAVGAHFLARQITGSVPAGLVAGLLFGFSGFRMMHIGELNVLALAGLPWAFLDGHLYLETGRRRHLYVAAFFAWLVAVSCTFSLWYLLIAPLPLVVLLALPRFHEARRQVRRHQGHMILALTLFVLLVTPFVRPYLNHDLEQALARSRDDSLEVAQPGTLSTLGEGFFTSLFLRDHGKMPVRAPAGRWGLILALLLIPLAIIRSGPPEREVLYYGTLAGICLALGLLLPVRTSGLFSMAIAVLGALAVRQIERFAAVTSTGRRLVWLLPLVVAIDLVPGPLHLHQPLAQAGPPPSAVWLADVEEGAPLAEFPSPPDSAAGDSLRAVRQLDSTYHWLPLVDGQMSRTPPLTRVVRHRLAAFPAEGAVAQLRALNVDVALVHLGEYPDSLREEIEERVEARPEFKLESSLGWDRIYRLDWEALPPPSSR